MQTAEDYETNFLAAQVESPALMTAEVLVGKTFLVEQPEPTEGPLVS